MMIGFAVAWIGLMIVTQLQVYFAENRCQAAERKVAALEQLVDALAHRCKIQSELLARAAESSSATSGS